MVKESIIVEHKKSVLDGTKTYCLYDNKEQDNLLAMAYDCESVEEESKYYSEGVWFEFDNVVDSNIMLNEKKYKKRIKFPSKPEKRPSYLETSEQFKFNSGVGDIR